MKKVRKRIYNKITNEVVAFTGLFSAKISSKLLYYFTKKEKLNLENPIKFNEKLMWLKLNNYNYNETIWKCSDKYIMREYAISKGIDEKNLTKLLGVYNTADEINFSNLPEKFALKCTHGSGFNVVCLNKNNLNIKQTKKKLNRWLKTKFGKYSAETHYNHIEPKIICEEFIESNSDGIMPNDYKFYCFNGEPKVILVCTKRNSSHHESNFYDMNWNSLHLRKDDCNCDIKKPTTFDEMVTMSRLLSKEFPFVRVDFYELNGKSILGELTFTPAACVGDYTDEGDKYLSDMLNIENKI